MWKTARCDSGRRCAGPPPFVEEPGVRRPRLQGGGVRRADAGDGAVPALAGVADREACRRRRHRHGPRDDRRRSSRSSSAARSSPHHRARARLPDGDRARHGARRAGERADRPRLRRRARAGGVLRLTAHMVCACSPACAVRPRRIGLVYFALLAAARHQLLPRPQAAGVLGRGGARGDHRRGVRGAARAHRRALGARAAAACCSRTSTRGAPSARAPAVGRAPRASSCSVLARGRRRRWRSASRPHVAPRERSAAPLAPHLAGSLAALAPLHRRAGAPVGRARPRGRRSSTCRCSRCSSSGSTCTPACRASCGCRAGGRRRSSARAACPAGAGWPSPACAVLAAVGFALLAASPSRAQPAGAGDRAPRRVGGGAREHARRLPPRRRAARRLRRARRPGVEGRRGARRPRQRPDEGGRRADEDLGARPPRELRTVDIGSHKRAAVHGRARADARRGARGVQGARRRSSSS